MKILRVLYTKEFPTCLVYQERGIEAAKDLR